MPCAVAVPNSPIFSPTIIPSMHRYPSSSPRIHGPASAAPPPPVPPTPTPPPTLSFQVREVKKDAGGGSVLKRKRPARLDIPLTSGITNGPGLKTTPCGDDRLDEVEVDGEGYSVYCKRGKRGSVMEDRYSALVDHNGQSKQVLTKCDFINVILIWAAEC